MYFLKKRVVGLSWEGRVCTGLFLMVDMAFVFGLYRTSKLLRLVGISCFQQHETSAGFDLRSPRVRMTLKQKLVEVNFAARFRSID